ncbi:MAG: aldehyde ferredoxin oxidoreductase C-terminal domain-containing protein [Gammaproteobacteria bacterium]|jgi:aldehyde:ferredoxin oxidoreductase|nr:aldehyde ferredoxin oxidoreductase C-terminal domain-containing protein [Gammaproteobacteria bacterium]
MRNYLHIDLSQRNVSKIVVEGEELAQCGRYHIAHTLLAEGVATVDPLGTDNPLIFSVGPFAGTSFSNANRISVGCKSPLTGGIKEANSGGTFGLAMGHLEILGFTLHGMADDWLVMYITKDGEVRFDCARPYLGQGNNAVATMLHKTYGPHVSLAICGPVGEYQGLIAGIAFSDPQGRPVRLAARGGVGAVMGSKRVKAIVIDKGRTPPLHDRKKVARAVREYGKFVSEQPGPQTLHDLGTAFMADVANHVGGLPVDNFSRGQQIAGQLPMGGEAIRIQNLERGGDQSHSCMPGCMIKCSNVYAGADGREVVAPLEYETIGLMGTNCGLTEPDNVAELNAIANDLGIDSIETGATLALLMEAGLAEFGDVGYLNEALNDIRLGNERGRLLSQGAARVGEHYSVARVPVVKKQALSAYDPRVMEVTGISMMVSPQGGDHTTGNVGGYPCAGKPLAELVDASMKAQISAASADSFGMCIFGRSATDPNHQLLADTVNNIHGTQISATHIAAIGVETLRLERLFNKAAGFTDADDSLPEFFYREALPPTNNLARLEPSAIKAEIEQWWQTQV